jgi:hypothetical protein
LLEMLGGTRESDGSGSLSSAGQLFSRSAIDGDVVARLLEQKLKTIGAYAVEDAADAASDFAPDATAWFVTEVLQHVLDERDVDGLDVVVAEKAMVVLAAAVGAVEVATKPEWSNAVDVAKQKAKGDDEKGLVDMTFGILAMDIAWSAMRNDKDLRKSFRLDPEVAEGICMRGKIPIRQRTNLITDVAKADYRKKYEIDDLEAKDLCKAASEAAKQLARAVGGEGQDAAAGPDWGSDVAELFKVASRGTKDAANEVINKALLMITSPDIRNALVRGFAGADSAASDYVRGTDPLDRRAGDLKGDAKEITSRVGVLDIVLSALASAVRADRDTGKVEVHLEDLASDLSRHWYRKEGFAPYLSVGTGYLHAFGGEDSDSSALFAEKIGVVYRHRLTDPAFARTRSGSSHSVHAGLYGSGLLYSLTIGKDDRAPYILAGAFTGLTIYGALDLNVGLGLIAPLNSDADQPTRGQVSVTLEIPLHEYVEALSKK